MTVTRPDEEPPYAPTTRDKIATREQIHDHALTLAKKCEESLIRLCNALDPAVNGKLIRYDAGLELVTLRITDMAVLTRYEIILSLSDKVPSDATKLYDLSSWLGYARIAATLSYRESEL